MAKLWDSKRYRIVEDPDGDRVIVDTAEDRIVSSYGLTKSEAAEEFRRLRSENDQAWRDSRIKAARRCALELGDGYDLSINDDAKIDASADDGHVWVEAWIRIGIDEMED